MLTTSLAVLAFSAVADAHFRLNEPYWRGDSFATGRSQWSWPCANVSQENSSTNRTSWPLDGGSVVLSSSHETVITYINLGLGDEVTGFNVSLLAAYNMVGNGTVCLPSVGAEALAALNLTDGQTASIQVVHIGDSGNALYNCADIVFNTNATILTGDACVNSTGITGYALELDSETAAGEHEHSNETTPSGSAAAAGASATGSSDATSSKVGMGALVGAAAIAVGALLA